MTTNSPIKSLLIAAVLAATAAACAGNDEQDATENGTGVPSSSTSVELPLVELELDEDSPQNLKEAVDQSDWVVLAKVVSITDGARFYGEALDDPDPATIVYEDVFLNLEIVSVFKGDPTKELSVRWPGYVGSDASGSSRTGNLLVEGVSFTDTTPDGEYLMFLKQYDEPFGLSPVALSSAVIEIDDAVSAQERQVSTVFDQQLERFDLESILEQAGLV